MKTFIFLARNSSIVITINADNEDDARAEIAEYFDENSVDSLVLDQEYNADNF